MAKQNFKLDKFIERVLIENIGKVVDDNNHYLSFALVAQGIELLGTIIEDDPNHDFEANGRSRTRFKLGLSLLGNPEYVTYCSDTKRDATEFDLYKHLRCGFAHQLRPTGKLGLTHDEEMARELTEHLKVNADGQLVLNVDTLYRDFKAASEKVIKKIADNELTHEKAYRNFIAIDREE